jgi:small GTP-binding protein
MFLGAAQTGKTMLIERHITGTFNEVHTPTVKAIVHPVVCTTNKGTVTFLICDNTGSMPDPYYEASHACVVVCDVTRPETIKNAVNLARQFRSAAPDTPMILVGNKVDLGHHDIGYRQLKKKLSVAAKKIGAIAYYPISARNTYNIEKPSLDIVQHYLGKDTLIYTNETISEYLRPLDELLARVDREVFG